MRLPFNRRMRLFLSLLIRPLFFLILLGLSSFIVVETSLLIKQFKSNQNLLVDVVHNQTVSEIENAAKMLLPLNSSTLNLARALSTSLNGTDLSFPIIQAKVAPPLFQALTTIPRVTEVGYIGLDKLTFSYYHDDDQTFAMFSNSSSSSSSYTQPVNRDTGKLFGEAVSSNSTVSSNTSWFRYYLSSLPFNTSSLPVNTSSFPQSSDRPMPYLSLEMGKNGQDLLFKSTVPMDGRGLISIGFPANEVNTQFSNLDFHGGYLHLAANDGRVLVETKLPDTEITVDNGTVSLKWKKPYGDQEDEHSNISCKSDDTDLVQLDVVIRERKHKLYCSIINVAGIDSVYALLFPADRMEAAAQRNSMLAIILLVLMLVGTVISLCLFIFFILKAARREVVLCDALIKQKESTQQAERKSMSKTNAFAMNSHDLRASLEAIPYLIDSCHADVVPNSQLASILSQINTNVRDQLGLLSTVLDNSKIEAGKIELVEEEFNLAQVLEDVVDKFYPIGIRRGLEVILDPSDGSILKFYLVRGDRQRLKEILENLVNNAIKFTSNGTVVVRILARKTSKENAIIASNRRSALKCLSSLCYKSNGSLRSLDDIHTVHENPNCMEFIFEVDDTGCGIPKERQKSVFENYVQVKPTSKREGWGLGLGIVQSLVRLMGGEIRIVDKEIGERGTCFRFNIFLPICNPPSADIEEHGNHIPSGAPSSDLLQYIGVHIRSPMTRLEGFHVVLLVAEKERRKVSKKVIENFGIKVSAAETSTELKRILDKIKEKLEFSLSEKCESSSNECLSASNNSNSGLNERCSGTKTLSSKGLHNFILIVIDAAAGPSLEVSSVVSNFKHEARSFQCKVLWWDNPVISISNSRQPKEDKPHPFWNYTLSTPLHGSVLYQVLGLLPGFRGTFLPDSFKVKFEAIQECQNSTELVPSDSIIPSGQTQQLEEIVKHDQTNDHISTQPLKGKSVLLVEDQKLISMVGCGILSKNGAKVDVCRNGKEAFEKVWEALNNKRKIHQKALPFDYIFMDCQMPEMNGYEATRLIREEEKLHGIHIPIFALTSHDEPEESRKMFDAGMDFHLCKPLKDDKLLDAIRRIESRSEH